MPEVLAEYRSRKRKISQKISQECLKNIPRQVNSNRKKSKSPIAQYLIFYSLCTKTAIVFTSDYFWFAAAFFRFCCGSADFFYVEIKKGNSFYFRYFRFTSAFFRFLLIKTAGI
jgi:hypothetical protein